MKRSVLDIIHPLQIRQIHRLEFGNFFFLQNTIIAEISEGIVYDWSKGKQVIDLALEAYGPNFPLHYISNRINDYSVRPQDWLKFKDHRHYLRTYSIVTYDKTGFTNLIFEKLFYTSKIYHFQDLPSALNFVDHLNWQLSEII